MNMTLQRIRTEAKALTADEREVLLAALDFDMQREDALSGSDASAMEAAWDAEIKNRADEVRAGKARLLSTGEFLSAFDDAREALALEASQK